jgi:hypothetical protein
MYPLLYSLLFGLIGGFIRGLVGFRKDKVLRNGKFRVAYLVISVIISAIVGAAAGALAGQSWQISFLAGYAGTDFIESLYMMKLARGF